MGIALVFQQRVWTFFLRCFACEERGLSYQLCESLSGTLAAICFFTLQVLYPAGAVFLWVILPIPPQESRPPLPLPILSFPPGPWSRTTLFLKIVVLCWSFKSLRSIEVDLFIWSINAVLRRHYLLERFPSNVDEHYTTCSLQRLHLAFIPTLYLPAIALSRFV